MNQSEGTYKATILNNTIQYNLAKADPSPGLAKCLKYNNTCTEVAGSPKYCLDIKKVQNMNA